MTTDQTQTRAMTDIVAPATPVPAQPASNERIERIERIAAACRESSLPEQFIVALVRYLGGLAPLDDVRQEWRAEYLRYPHEFLKTLTETLDRDESGAGIASADEDNAAQGERVRSHYRFDDVERRILDLCLSINEKWTQLAVYDEYLRAILSRAAPLAEIRDYLVSQGMSEQDFVTRLVAGSSYPNKRNVAKTTLHTFLLTYMPDRFQMLADALGQDSRAYHIASMIEMFCAAQPPYLDEAWQLVQELEKGNNGSTLLGCMKLLLDADYARFNGWVRRMLEPGVLPGEMFRADVFKLLFPYDPAGHTDLALKLTQEPVTDRHGFVWTQQAALTALFTADPAAWWHLIEQAAPNRYFHMTVIGLIIAELDAEQPRIGAEQGYRALQTCIATENNYNISKALTYLLTHEWPGRVDYALSLLPHRSKQMRHLVRNEVVAWLVQQSEQDVTIFERVAPFTTHKGAAARLAAIEMLGRIDATRARAVFAPLVKVEQSHKARQAMLDLLVGASALTESEMQANHAGNTHLPTMETLRALWVAESEKTLKRAAKRVPAWATTLPEASHLRWRDGAPIEPRALAYLLHQQAQMKDGQLAPSLPPIMAQIDRSTSGAYALALVTAWSNRPVNVGSNHLAPPREAWLLAFAGALGDDRLITLLRQQIARWGRGSRRVVATKAMRTLALMDSDTALRALDDLSLTVKNPWTRLHMRALVAETAVARNVIIDTLTPTLGLDARSELTVSFGGNADRRFTVKLGVGARTTLIDASGALLKTLPAARIADDPAQVAEAQKAVRTIRAEALTLYTKQGQRLEEALTYQRAWSVECWRDLFLRHPVLRLLASGLLWSVAHPDRNGYTLLFRPLEDGTLTGADDEPIDLPAYGAITLAHPALLTETMRVRWKQHLVDYDIHPPFAQLDRPFHTLADDERSATRWERYAGRMSYNPGYRSVTRDGWKRADGQDYLYMEFGSYERRDHDPDLTWFTRNDSIALKPLPQAQMLAWLDLSIETTTHETLLSGLRFIRNRRPLPLGEIPPVLLSEVAAEALAHCRNRGI
ncbi:MAG: DUF4132 domain-containing protein [Ktedonobacterales bacterium]